MKCPEPNIKEPCYFCYNGECFATHWYECSKGFRKPPEGKKGNKNNRYCKKENSMEIIVYKPHGMNFDLDIIPSIHISYQKSMNNFWYVNLSWLLWGVTFRKNTSTKKKQQNTYTSIYDVFNNKTKKGE